MYLEILTNIKDLNLTIKCSNLLVRYSIPSLLTSHLQWSSIKIRYKIRQIDLRFLFVCSFHSSLSLFFFSSITFAPVFSFAPLLFRRMDGRNGRDFWNMANAHGLAKELAKLMTRRTQNNRGIMTIKISGLQSLLKVWLGFKARHRTTKRQFYGIIKLRKLRI